MATGTPSSTPADPLAQRYEDTMIEAIKKAMAEPSTLDIPLEDNTLRPWWDHYRDKPALGVHKLLFLRYVTWRAARRTPTGKSAPRWAREVAYSWLDFLLGPAANGRSFFLQHFLTTENLAFYIGNEPTDLQPTPRKCWPDSWKNRDTRTLPIIERPQNLTILEMEIALAIFEWNAKKPRLVWWIREYPHILRRIHQVLLRTYGFALLHPLRRAMKTGTKGADTADSGNGATDSSSNTSNESADQEGYSLYRAPYIASIGWRCYPRLAGLVTIGLLGILSINYVLTFLFAGPLGSVIAGGGAALALIAALILMDVFKQNRGVLVSERHALPRTWGVVWRALLYGAAEVTALVFMLRALLSYIIDRGKLESWVAYRQLPDMALPHVTFWASCGWIVRFTVMGLGAVLLGLLLQWFWEDRSVIEPI
jgi:hypothetical protein